MTLYDSDETAKTAEHLREAGVVLQVDWESRDGVKQEPEEALETHEVVELNKFIMKKQWIEEKSKFLESIPPVDVFAAVETLTGMKEEISPELPTRSQLNHWLEEQDGIEKETEIFDTEDMSKLKKLTKAATQRNLSPEDTDLIELTLTTLIALDKLLHLLRDRSETLDLLGLRLTWEEQRVAAWKDRSTILHDLHKFLITRARWSPETYESIPRPTSRSPTPSVGLAPSSPSHPSSFPSRRRDSTSSFTSVSSETSILGRVSSAVSRSTRYKLAEMLSHDAAQFSARITALNHGRIISASKTLDKLIDASRIPVPDEILDAQDYLEDKGVKEIESSGKFAMSIVMQWTSADEYFNDTKKDQDSAQALIADIDNAKLQPPTAKQDVAFTARAQALAKRIAVRGDPSTSRSLFPRPTHPLFPDQNATNQSIVKTLSNERAEAIKLARKAELSAGSYHTQLESVKRAESLCGHVRNVDQKIQKLTRDLLHGVQEDQAHGDCAPPKLNEESCLDPMCHATYLALLPSVVQQLEMAIQSSETLLRDGKAALLGLKEVAEVNGNLMRDLSDAIKNLESSRAAAELAKEDALSRVQRLKEARRLWSVLRNTTRSLEDFKKDAMDGIRSRRRKVQKNRGDAILTPEGESPVSNHIPLPATLSPVVLCNKLDELEEQISTNIKAPVSVLEHTLEPELSRLFHSSCEAASRYIDDLRSLARLWNDILKQAEEMLSVTREARDLEASINSLQANIDDSRQELSDKLAPPEEISAVEAGFRAQASTLQASIKEFTDTLATRVHYVSSLRETRLIHGPSDSTAAYSPLHGDLNGLKGLPSSILPFELSDLNHDVRVEINAVALDLAGGMQSVEKGLDYLHLVQLAKAVDIALEDLSQDNRTLESAVLGVKEIFDSLKKTSPLDLLQQLSHVREQLDRIAQDHCPRISRSMPSVRQSLDALKSARGAYDSPLHGTIVGPRAKNVDEACRRSDSILEGVTQLKMEIMDYERQEEARYRMERERTEAEERNKREEAWKASEKKIDQERMEPSMEEREGLGEISDESSSDLRQEQSKVEALTGLDQYGFIGDPAKNKKTEMDGEGQPEEQEKTLSDGLQQGHPITVGDVSEDVFGIRLDPSSSSVQPLSEAMTELRGRILSLQNRLRSLEANSLASAPDNHLVYFPTQQQALSTQSAFSAIVSEVSALPPFVQEDATIDSELRLLRSHVNTAQVLVERVLRLVQFNDVVSACDRALSDLLEHTDTYPAAPPVDQLASTHVSDTGLPCEEQLTSRLAFTKHSVEEMTKLSSSLADDQRVASEERRLRQTMSELADMCEDRINGTRSRPASSIYSTQSTGSAEKPTVTLQAHRRPGSSDITLRRAMSGSHKFTPRASTHTSNRSVSGPTGFSSSLLSSTFSSRQRTTSLVSIQSPITTHGKRPTSPTTKPYGTSKRPGSPTFSEMSRNSLASSTPSRSSWSRTPLQSFGSVSRNFQTQRPHKKYVPNPKSKLDVAVGNVVNNFKMAVTMQAADGWKDLSGKYWVGESDPKLCFCRILRSQTVMVRVGGGWCELSNFLRGHFAELSLEATSPPARREERWISSATILETAEASVSPPTPNGQILQTPPKSQHAALPSIQLFTPNSASPQTPLENKSSPSPGSSPDMIPFRYMRKADPGIRAVTPSPAVKTAGKKHAAAVASTPVTPAAGRTSTNFWRP